MGACAEGSVLPGPIYSEADGFDIDVLATDAADMTTALGPALDGKDYRTVLWLKSAYPLWDAPETKEEFVVLSTETETLLKKRLAQSKGPIALEGTMNLDIFELQTYSAKP